MQDDVYEASLSPEIRELLSKNNPSSSLHKKSRNLMERMKTVTFNSDRVWKLIEGSIDVHIHGGPEAYVTRLYDELEMAIKACEAGMQAIVFKCHSSPSTRSASIVQKVVNQWADEHKKKKLEVLGGVVLNYEVGGLNPSAVAASIAMGGKMVWMPTRDASHHKRASGETGGIDVLDSNGNVTPQLKEIFSLIAESDAVLSLTHQSTRERLTLIDEAKKSGIKRIEVGHPLQAKTRMTMEQMKIAADKGAYLGMYCLNFEPQHWSWELFMQAVKEIGCEKIIAATDSGNYQFSSPVDLLRVFITGMLDRGISDKDVETMVKTNPRNLLY